MPLRFGLNERLEGVIFIPWSMVTGCCALEVENTNESTYDWKRLGVENSAVDPSQADVLLVGGWISPNAEERVKRIYSQLSGPRYVVAYGACAISGSPYSMSGEKVRKASDFLPVDVFVPGCPPRPEALIEAIQLLRKRTRNLDQNRIIYEALKGPSRN